MRWDEHISVGDIDTIYLGGILCKFDFYRAENWLENSRIDLFIFLTNRPQGKE